MTKTATPPAAPSPDDVVDQAVDQVDAVDEPAGPPPVDLLDLLTIAEIDAGSRELGTSLVGQITRQGERYERALAVVLWLHRRRVDRRTEPRELLRQLSQLRFVELQEQLTAEAARYAPEDDGEADPLA